MKEKNEMSWSTVENGYGVTYHRWVGQKVWWYGVKWRIVDFRTFSHLKQTFAILIAPSWLPLWLKPLALTLLLAREAAGKLEDTFPA